MLHKATKGHYMHTAQSIPQNLSELPESQATGQIRDIYHEIRQFSGVPMVALIYRHMATIPGVLEWAWETLRPLMVSGLLQERAWQLVDKVTLPEVLPISALARRAAGITQEEDALIAASLAAFNRSNPINVVALGCLKRQLNGSNRTASGLTTRAWVPPSSGPALPAMLEPDAMPSGAKEVVSHLCHRGQHRYAGIWPSLYRYLAHVPPYLGFAAVILPPHFSGIDRAVIALNEEVDQAANDLAALIPTPAMAAPSDAAQETLLRAMDNFTLLIPEMVVIGTLLERATYGRHV
jgi:hypothetical protein